MVAITAVTALRRLVSDIERVRLSEQVTWAITTTSYPQLKGRVRFVGERDGPLHLIVDHYSVLVAHAQRNAAWVEPHVPRPLVEDQDNESERLEVASIVRAVTFTSAAVERWCVLEAPGQQASRSKIRLRPTATALRSQSDGLNLADRIALVADANSFVDLPGHLHGRSRSHEDETQGPSERKSHE